MFRVESPWWLKVVLILVALPSLVFAHRFSAWLLAAFVVGSLAAFVRSYIGGGSE